MGASSTDIWFIVTAVGLTVLASLLAAAEASLTSFSTVRADELVRDGRKGAARLRRLVEDPARVLSTTVFVRLACEVGSAILVTTVFADLFEIPWQAMLAAFGVLLVANFIAVGVAPRTLGRQYADKVALASAGPLTGLTRLLGPISALLILVGNAITPGRGFREGPFASEAELRAFVDLAERDRLIEKNERQMIHSVFELGDTLVKSVMVPRPDMVVIEQHKTLRQFMSLALSSGYSRIPVIGESVDDIVGIAYLKDVTKRVYDHREAETLERVESMLRPAEYVPDSKPVDELLREMQALRIHVAVVIDEYGGTAGLVTIEDVLEEIVGEIADEYDTGADEVQPLGDDSFRVSSRFNIDDLGDLFGLKIDDDDVDSVGGLMAKELGRVPLAGTRVEVHGLVLVAERGAGRRNRIGSVVVSRVEQEAESEA